MHSYSVFISYLAQDLRFSCFPDFLWEDVESSFAILKWFLRVLSNHLTLEGQHLKQYGVFGYLGSHLICVLLLAESARCSFPVLWVRKPSYTPLACSGCLK